MTCKKKLISYYKIANKRFRNKIFALINKRKNWKNITKNFIVKLFSTAKPLELNNIFKVIKM